MRFFSRLLPVANTGHARTSGASATQQGPLVHVFVFDSGGAGDRDPRYVTRLVRSLVPESVAYEDVPISFFVDKDIPAAVAQCTALQLDALMNYRFAWSKIKETNPALVEGLEAGIMSFTFSWKGYEREDGGKGVLFAFYSLGDCPDAQRGG